MPHNIFSPFTPTNPTGKRLAAAIREQVHAVLDRDNGACAQAILPYLVEPGPTGSKEYDHARAVATLLDFDERFGGYLTDLKQAAGMTHRDLWPVLVQVYRANGFRFSRGRLVGLLEAPGAAGAVTV